MYVCHLSPKKHGKLKEMMSCMYHNCNFFDNANTANLFFYHPFNQLLENADVVFIMFYSRCVFLFLNEHVCFSFESCWLAG